MEAGYVSKAKLEKVEQRAERARMALKHLKTEGMKATKVGLRSAAVAGAAGIVGYIEGKADKIEDTHILSMPLGLALGIAGTVINVAGYGGDEQTSELIQGAADGALASYVYSKGHEMGVDSKTAA